MFLSATVPLASQFRAVELLEKLTVQGKYLNQYTTQCLTYSGDKTSPEFVKAREAARSVYGQESQEIVDTLDISKATGLKQSVLALSSMVFTNYPAGTPNATFGNGSWASLEACSLAEVPSLSAIASVQLLSDLVLKIKYLKQYTTQLLSMDPEKNLADYTATATLCQRLYTNGPFSTSTTQESGIRQILWALDAVNMDDATKLGNGCWPRVRTQLLGNIESWKDSENAGEMKVRIYNKTPVQDSENISGRGVWYFSEYSDNREEHNIQDNIHPSEEGFIIINSGTKQDIFNIDSGAYTFASGSRNRFLTPDL